MVSGELTLWENGEKSWSGTAGQELTNLLAQVKTTFRNLDSDFETNFQCCVTLLFKVIFAFFVAKRCSFFLTPFSFLQVSTHVYLKKILSKESCNKKKEFKK